jgi:hypothetical protein
MGWFKRNPFFYTILSLLLAATVGGVWFASNGRDELVALKEQYENKNRQLQMYIARSPAPTKANLDALDRNYVRLNDEFRKVQSSLNLNTYDRELFFGQAPESRNDAFFMVAKFVDDVRNMAVGSGVKVPDDCRYGFSEYENVGPEVELVERVHRQSKIMESLLLTLFDSGISEFVSIKREPSVEEDADKGDSGDLFSLKNGRSIGSAEAFNSLAFQLEFKGQSLSLRNFLNRVNSSSLPFSINEIEVRLDRETGSVESRSSVLENPFVGSSETESSMSAVRVPIIAENESFFVITLEFLDLVESPVTASVDKSIEGRKDV